MKNTVKQIEEEVNSVFINETIEVDIKQLLFIYKAIEDCRAYFHNPAHYPSIEELKKFIGNKEEGMYSILNHIYLKIFEEILPDNIKENL